MALNSFMPQKATIIWNNKFQNRQSTLPESFYYNEKNDPKFENVTHQQFFKTFLKKTTLFCCIKKVDG